MSSSLHRDNGALAETARTIVEAEIDRQVRHMSIPSHVEGFLRQCFARMDLQSAELYLLRADRIQNIHERNYDRTRIRSNLQRSTRIFVDRAVRARIEASDDVEDHFYLMDEWILIPKVRNRISAFCNLEIYPCFQKERRLAEAVASAGPADAHRSEA